MKNKKKRKVNNEARCPYCGRPARIIPAAGILPDHAKVTHLLACSNYPKCDSYVCVHPGTTKPMGVIANAELRKLRQQAHIHFNKLYQTGIMSKDDAYAWLADKIWAPRSEAHIGQLSEYYLQLVIAESKRLMAYRRSPVCPSYTGSEWNGDQRLRA